MYQTQLTESDKVDDNQQSLKKQMYHQLVAAVADVEESPRTTTSHEVIPPDTNWYINR